MIYKELQELPPDKRLRGEQELEGNDVEGKPGKWKVFICYGCQTCWRFVDEKMEKTEEAYPHFLSAERTE